MNEKKIAFILCVNDDSWLRECQLYIQQLERPEGLEIEVLAVKEASSMAAGYNEGMNATDAKYKVYLHQDVFIINRRFIFDILHLFEKEDIGLIGIVGTHRMPKDGIMWNNTRYGNLHDLPILSKKFQIRSICPIEGEYMEVEAIDGMLMATQVDIRWRDDIFKKWDYYDVSQSFEFRRKGYKVIVPEQKKAWCIHECGRIALWNFEEERAKFLKEYGEMLGGEV